MGISLFNSFLFIFTTIYKTKVDQMICFFNLYNCSKKVKILVENLPLFSAMIPIYSMKGNFIRRKGCDEGGKV